ncbi:ATP-binding protein [Amycolatopsis anabasis]|uniref:ATP-binding protein n=1 Tax=Amycolatopsis anabasis TaxID=1840409 RepID=UPI00131ACEDD|nr:AAA family ATPase [Amycolatopsis anabasis]
MLIGREHPLRLLREEVDRCLAGRGGVALVAGEAGIGKTTLINAVATGAEHAGARVLGGACWDGEGAPDHWPWTQVLRELTPHSPALDGEHGFRLYDAVMSVLVAAGRERPLVLVLEDLHRADPASIRLLEFISRHAGREPLLVLGTYRDVEVESAQHPLRAGLLSVREQATALTLTGHEPAEVAILMARATGTRPSPEAAARLHRRTGGNPFFVVQTARAAPSDPHITPAVRAALSHRLSRVPPEVLELLTAAAVLGREFDRRLLVATLAVSGERAGRLLDHAVALRLLAPREANRFVFVHGFVRELLYDSLDETGVDYLLTAARATMGRPAAAGYLRRALQLLPTGQRRRHALVHLDLGKAQHYARRQADGRHTFATVVALARELQDDDLLARTALTLYGLSHPTRRERFTTGVVDEAHRRLVRAAAGPAMSFDRAAAEISARAATMARRDNDDTALQLSLLSRHDTILGPGTARERLAITDDLSEIALRTADRELDFRATRLRMTALLELDDPQCLAEFDAFATLATSPEPSPLRFETCWSRTTFATLRGDFAEARALIAELGALDPPYADSASVARHLLWAVELTQGRIDEADTVLAGIMRADHPCPELVAACTAAARGGLDEARRVLADTPAHHPELPGLFVPLWLRARAQAAATTRDPGWCEQARAAIEPYRGQWAVTAGATVDGPMVYWLAVLDAAQQRWDDAISGFTAAWRAAERLQARPWSIEARLGLAEAMTAGAGSADDTAVTTLLDGVRRDADAVGMTQAAERAGNLRPRGCTAAPPPSGNEFRLDDEVWTIRFAGHTVHLADAKGLRDLHLLLQCAGHDVPAVALLNPEGGAVVVAARSFGGDPVLDREAEIRYRHRLGQLDEETARATDLGDDARVAELDRERDALLNELRTAAGLAHRPRRLGDQTERARKAVSGRIHAALRRIDQRHPALAEHLRASVTTGSTCRYRPATPMDWVLR